jgi:hypothetical protein
MGMPAAKADETKNRLNSADVCCHSGQNLSSGHFQKGKKLMTIILPIVLLECLKFDLSH